MDDNVHVCMYRVSDLMELAKVRRVHRFVPEHSVDGEVLARGEGLVLGEAVEHLGGDRRGVRAQQILRGLFALEDAAVADAAVAAALVRGLHPLQSTEGKGSGLGPHMTHTK